MSYFDTLNGINVNDKTETKNGLTYLSWAWAWGEVKKAYPEAKYTIYENADGWFYHTDGKTCWVKTGVMIDGLEHIEYLPVMDYKNRSIPADTVTSFDVNKAIQRSLTKAVARHGLGLYIYAGEDLPESAVETTPVESRPVKKETAKTAVKVTTDCGEVEYAKRRSALLSLMQTYNKTNQEYVLTAGDVNIRTMTSQEFDEFVAGLTNKWLVS
jgi:hypothetical protein